MRKLFYSSIIALFLLSCKKERNTNNFDNIIHFVITDEIASKNDTVKRFNEVFSSVNGHKINFQTFEKELISYGYLKNPVPKEKIKKIDEFLTNDINYESHLTACVPSYRDILILKKNSKTVSVLKLCFECGMVDKYGVIESNYSKNTDFDTYIMNLEVFNKILYGKTH
ncbi:hypothetical protein KBJ98_11750 [Flavobacterium sp. F-328]|uniref:Lipoprotein n=1 Tax=Flavobacterium erciyesense TaxID=2825842 RepID=A0ABS5D5Q9_9FLAO|nr:hypothetical protein [Flavobacterium erciyesense]MBQ0909379.1 hypothetical protein [Flavobacterium erciyesense]